MTPRQPSRGQRVPTRVLSSPGSDEDSLTTRDADEPRSSAADAVQLPDRVGRYSVELLLGTGGMGAVFGGWDPQLDRPVAIKVIHAARVRNTEPYRARLVREAQALAALSHPNVVTVYEAGTEGGDVFIAMERVDGPTLGEWIEQESRPWKEIVAMLIQAGRGLCAAHDKGIVHRDFKPSNVIIGADERARVLDFGLATLDGTASSAESSAGDPTDIPAAMSTRLTQAGTVMGTPAYMAPEQIRHRPITTATDQFSFCVALWEALWDERPFPGKTFAELRRSLGEGQRRAVPAGTEVPRRVIAAIERGLESDPRRRWPSLRELLDALERAVARRWSRWVLPGAVLVTGVGAAAALAVDSDDVRCDSGARGELLPWTEARRDGLAATFDQAQSSETWPVVERALDEYATAWAAGFVEVCDGGIGRAGDQRTFDLRIECLRQRGGAMSAVLGVLEIGDPEIVTHAPQTVDKLPSVAACLEVREGDPKTDLPQEPERAARVTELRAALARVAALLDSGRVAAARTAAEETAETAAALDFEPVVVEANLQLGIVESRLGHTEAAERRLTAAFWSASTLNYTAVGRTAAIELAWLTGYLLGRHADGVEWARHYEALSLRADANPERNLDAVLGPIYFDWQKFDLALPHLERNLAEELTVNPRSLDTAIARMNLAVLHYEAGDLERAAPHFEQAQAELEALYPDGHPDLALALINRAGLLYDFVGDLETARALAERGVAMSRAVNGERHASTALGLMWIGRFQSVLGEHETALQTLRTAVEGFKEASPSERIEARAELAEALDRAGRSEQASKAWQAIESDAEAELGARHPLLAWSKARHGWSLELQGDLAGAQRQRERALALLSDKTSRQAGRERFSLCELMLKQGQLDAALSLIEAEHRDATKRYGTTHPHTRQATLHHAQVLAARDDQQAARSLLESLTAGATAAVSAADREVSAVARFELATLVANQEPERARSLAESALATLNALAEADQQRQRVQRWLARVAP